MDSGQDPPQRGGLGSTNDHLSPLTRSYSQAAADELAYGDPGISPEDVPTTVRPPIAALSELSANASGISEDEEIGLEGIKPSLYQIDARRRRAKLPDEETPLRQVNNTNGTAGGSAQNDSKTSRWRWRRRHSRPPNASTLNEKSKLRHVMLQWGKAEMGPEKLVLNAKVVDQRRLAGSESQKYVSWHHLESNTLLFGRLNDLVVEAKEQGLQESEARLTHRLIGGVKRKAEKPFVGGSFLNPLSLRYDSMDDSKYNVGKCSTFIAFPYFLVAKEGISPLYEKAKPDHPIRTLLQSCYRLNDTSERDETQCIRMLSRKALRSCIKLEDDKLPDVSRKVQEELIYVPQLWALTLGLDKLVTMGPASDPSLQGMSFFVKDDETACATKRCFLVRLQFKNQGRLEHVTYPIGQCASWFGLLNKHQQIRGILQKGRESADPKDYAITVNDQKIEAKTWASVQRSCSDDVLKIWIKTPKMKIRKSSNPNIKVSLPGMESSQSTDHSEVEQDPAEREQDSEPEATDSRRQSATPTVYDSMTTVPVVKPFLHWRIVDESGESKELTCEQTVNRFLNAIFRSVPAHLKGHTYTPSSGAAPSTATRDLIAQRPTVQITGKNLHDVVNTVNLIILNRPEEHNQTASALVDEIKRLLGYFFLLNHDPQHPPVRLLWGAINEVLSRANPSYLLDILKKSHDLNFWAERIHLGVHYQQLSPQDPAPEPSTRQPDHYVDAISPDAILMSSLVDALGAIFNISKKVFSAYKDARAKLVKARDELITEASGMASGEHIGPVLTPEALLIMTMERLVKGVFENGNVNIIEILEECVEHLALKVRDRYSRRLLQMLNAFEEELNGVHDVLKQQIQVLSEFRWYLDPESFIAPSTARKLRFDFEKKGIDRILGTVREQVKNCKELQKRAKTLSIQNVQLVETLQDDNGRAIFIFTFITVLFLPLSFVAGFFGMNLKGVGDTSNRVGLFWKIAMPLTGGIILICAAVVKWGERIWFGFTTAPRRFGDLYKRGML
ncbi:uncharacterized protein KY384_007481 [Bacidia gigantensis]|uniref:uncharacterized protein n=1 Tax=Bacidia gigantensis TaxID=2732470 RepID=UPI001D04A8BE|nr:uncharacterized protein KY384_007481 [Bacidia gigantensis]KAG8527329.1 hypothetical protein KY384_007481 [Bacidia gigantensis]